MRYGPGDGATMTDQATLVTQAPPAEASRQRPRGERWSAWVFAAAVIAALPLLLWFGRDHWFYLDEWEVLGADGVTPTGYLDAHYGHWNTLLRLEYRLNFELWGLRSYVPYMVPAILGHLAIAVLVRQVCRRVGARGWIATTAALVFLFFGTGRESMTLGFQLAWAGSVVCGLVLFLMADGPRSVIRRDWLALGVGIVGLMTSGVFPPILVGFGVTTLLRRGARVTAFYALPLGVIYMAWYLRYGREETTPFELSTQAIRFAGRMFAATFDAFAQGGVGAVLVAVAGFGLGTAVHRGWRSGAWAEAAIPVGLAVGWATFAAVTAVARAMIPQVYSSGRYLYVGAALLLPLVAAGAEQLARRRLVLGVAALLPLAVGLPRNLDRFTQTPILFRTDRQLTYAIAHSPFIDDAPADSRPLQDKSAFQPPATAAWLARQAAAGRIPEPDEPLPPQLELTAASRLVLTQATDTAVGSACPALTAPVTASLERGDEIPFAGAIEVTLTDGTHESAPRRFLSFDPAVLRAQAGPVDVVVRSIPEGPGSVCPPVPDDR
jgi:hypothetical protein